MEDQSTVCPTCHVQVKINDYFCFNCGASLKQKPPSVSSLSQISVYAKSLLLPPLGVIIGLRYLRQKDNSSKIVGIVAILITIIPLIFMIITTIKLTKFINTQVDQQLLQMGY